MLAPAGREWLLELLRAPEVTTPPRNGLMLPDPLGHNVGPDAIAALIAETRQQLLGGWQPSRRSPR